MKKKMKYFILTLAIIVGFIICNRSVFINSCIDRVNPCIAETVSYAQVPKGTQSYYQVKAFDPKTGKELPYRLKKVGGYDPQGSYIAIKHKGQYVRSIRYISRKEFETRK